MFFIPSNGPDSWKEFQAEPEKQWAAPVHPALAALVHPCTSSQDIPQDLWLIVGKKHRGFRRECILNN
jgi:hypothetical protein